MRASSKRFLSVLIGPCLAIGASHAAAGGPVITTIVKPGDPVPGMPDFEFSGVSGSASINNLGELLFTATISGPGSNLFNDHVLVKRTIDGTMTILARENDPVPTVPGYIYRGGSANTSVFLDLIIHDDGSVGVMSETLQGGTVRDMILTDRPLGPGLTHVAFEGGSAPGFMTGDTLLVIGQPISVQPGGLTAFAGSVFGSTNEDVVWFGSNAGLTAALQSGLQAPGQNIGATIANFDRESLRQNAMGEIAFGVTLDLGSGISQSNRRVIYSGPPNNLGVLAQTGSPVPSGGGAVYTSMDYDTLRVNDAGAVCFSADVSGGGTNEMIVTSGAGVTAPLIRDGDPIPDIPGTTYNLFNPRLEMNAGAQVAFNSGIFGAPSDSDTGLFVAEPGQSRLVLREGDVVDGVTVGGIGSLNFFSINDRGDVLVEVSADGSSTLIIVPNGGSPIKVARATEALVTDDGFVGIFGALVPWGIDRSNGSTQAGSSLVFNNEGQLALIGLFAGSTGQALVLIDFDGDPCLADINGDDVLDFFDVSELISTMPDLNGDGVFDFFDVSVFLTSFSAGCP